MCVSSRQGNMQPGNAVWTLHARWYCSLLLWLPILESGHFYCSLKTSTLSPSTHILLECLNPWKSRLVNLLIWPAILLGHAFFHLDRTKELKISAGARTDLTTPQNPGGKRSCGVERGNCAVQLECERSKLTDRAQKPSSPRVLGYGGIYAMLAPLCSFVLWHCVRVPSWFA